jgi:hypothetical protein
MGNITNYIREKLRPLANYIIESVDSLMDGIRCGWDNFKRWLRNNAWEIALVSGGVVIGGVVGGEVGGVVGGVVGGGVYVAYI